MTPDTTTKAIAASFRDAMLPFRLDVIGVFSSINLALAPFYFWSDRQLLQSGARTEDIVMGVIAIHVWITISSLAALAYFLARRGKRLSPRIDGAVIAASVLNYLAVATALAVLNQFDNGSIVIFSLALTGSVILSYERPGFMIASYVVMGAILLTANEGLQADLAIRTSNRLNVPLTVAAASVAYVLYDRIRVANHAQRLELARLNALKDTIFQALGHDLKNPLTEVRQAARILEDRSDDLHATRDQLAANLSSLAERSGLVIDNLLAIGASEDERRTLDPLPTSLRHTLTAAMQHVEPQAARKGVTLRTQLDDDVMVHVVPGLLEAVLRNLFDNAVKYSHPHAVVHVEVDVEPQEVCVTVRDEGVGMTPDRLAQVQAGTWTGSSHGTQGEAGTGIGLRVSRSFLSVMGSSLTVTSTEGNGTRVSFTVPRYRARV